MGSVLQTTFLALHLVIIIALVAFILLQPSEGGGLGMGGGDGMSGFMTGRSKANFFTRTTAFLAAGFFLTTLLIGILTGQGGQSSSIITDSEIQAVDTSTDVPAVTDVPVIGDIPAAATDVPASGDLPAAITDAPAATDVPVVGDLPAAADSEK